MAYKINHNCSVQSFAWRLAWAVSWHRGREEARHQIQRPIGDRDARGGSVCTRLNSSHLLRRINMVDETNETNGKGKGPIPDSSDNSHFMCKAQQDARVALKVNI